MEKGWPQEVVEFIQKRSTAVVSLITPENKPHAAAISYVTDSELFFYFISRPDSRKKLFLEKNPYVHMTIFDDSYLAESVQMDGVAKIVEEEEIKSKKIEEIVNRLWNTPQGLPTVFKINGGGLSLIKITPLEIQWLKNKDHSSPVQFSYLKV